MVEKAQTQLSISFLKAKEVTYGDYLLPRNAVSEKTISTSLIGPFSVQETLFTHDWCDGRCIASCFASERVFKPGLIVEFESKAYFAPDITFDEYQSQLDLAINNSTGIDIRAIQASNAEKIDFPYVELLNNEYKNSTASVEHLNAC